MNTITAVILAQFLAASALAGDIIGSYSCAVGDTFWTFDIPTDATNRWDSSSAESPPLSPKRAKDLAAAFMKRVPFGPGTDSWELDGITIDRIWRDPECWVYMVHFVGTPDAEHGGWEGPLPSFRVLVTMDGRIPEPRIREVKQTE